MKKLQSILSRGGDAVIEQRARQISELTEIESTNALQNLKGEKIRLEMKRQSMLDLSPDNRFSLKVGENFDPAKFLREMEELDISLIDLGVRIDVRMKMHEELFSEVEPHGKGEQ